MRRLTAFVMAALLSCVLGGCADPTPPDDTPPATDLTMRVLDVGKADCILLTTGDFVMLVDTATADAAPTVVTQLGLLGVTDIDLLLLTHNDQDHIGGVSQVLDAFTVKEVVQADYDEPSDIYTLATAALARHGITPKRLTAAETLTRGAATVTLWPAEADAGTKDNNRSVMTEIAVGDRRLLLAGDAQKARLKTFLDSAAAHAYDVVKLPHHGSWNGKTGDLLDVCGDADYIISTDKDNDAEPKLKDRLANDGRRVWYTYNGTVTVKIDGKNLAVTQ